MGLLWGEQMVKSKKPSRIFRKDQPTETDHVAIPPDRNEHDARPLGFYEDALYLWRPVWANVFDHIPLDDATVFLLIKRDASALKLRPVIERIKAWQDEIRLGQDAANRRTVLRRLRKDQAADIKAIDAELHREEAALVRARQAKEKLRRIGRELDPTKKGRWSSLPADLVSLYDHYRGAWSLLRREAHTLQKQHRAWIEADILKELRARRRKEISQKEAVELFPDLAKIKDHDELSKMLERLSEPLPGWDEYLFTRLLKETPSVLAVSILADMFEVSEDTIRAAIKRGKNG